MNIRPIDYLLLKHKIICTKGKAQKVEAYLEKFWKKWGKKKEINKNKKLRKGKVKCSRKGKVYSSSSPSLPREINCSLKKPATIGVKPTIYSPTLIPTLAHWVWADCLLDTQIFPWIPRQSDTIKDFFYSFVCILYM